MDALATVLLRRVAGVALPPPSLPAPADGGAWTSAFEADLAARGWLLDAPLRQRFAALDPATRLRWADWISAVADDMVGADRHHLPLFRAFPDTPADPDKLYVERLIVHLLQDHAAPCILCGVVDRVQPLDPCGHLVCAGCFSPDLYTACPICGRRLTGGSGYLPLIAPEPDDRREPTAPVRLRRLTLDERPADTAARVRDDLVARPAALGAADVADLHTLVAATVPDRLDWLPEVVPARETLAVVIAWALHAGALTDAYPRVLADAGRRWGTVTDVARTLWAYSGGDPGLIVARRPIVNIAAEAYRPVDEPPVAVPAPRVRALPRPLRRAVLSFVDSLDLVTAAEDVSRHPAVWKRLTERLHPYERVAAQPNAAVVFATLRGTRAPADSALGRAIAHAGARRPDRLVLSSHPDGTVSVRVLTFAALVERAVVEGGATDAATLLIQRPGDLWRRLDHLLRLAGDDTGAVRAVLDAAARVAGSVSPTVLASAAAQLAGRDATVAAEQPAGTAAAPITGAAATDAATTGGAMAGVVALREVGALGAALRRAVGLGSRPPAPVPAVSSGPEPGTPRRTFFPKGDVVRTWTAPERRGRLPLDAITELRATVDGELAARAARLDRFDVAVIDAALTRVPAPMRERADSGQLAGWPRGSVRSLADAEVLRLFLHWTDGVAGRVDLDLSCAFYRADWTVAGHCDYTRLRFEGSAAVHSGDLTSAPLPLGATEFLDLHRGRLLAAGVHWAVPVVLSYNDVPFDKLDAAFAGFSLPAPQGAQFDPARVMQKFSLRGDAKSLAPMVLEVASGEVMWVDAGLSTTGYGRSVGPHSARLGRVAADLWEHFGAGNRATLLDLVGWHAAARADRIMVCHADGAMTSIAVLDPVSTVTAIRAAATGAGDEVRGAPAAQHATGKVLAATVDPDRLAAFVGADVADGSVAVLVDGRAGAPWTPASTGELAAGLVPTA